MNYLKRGGSSARLQVFLVVSTCLLYLVAAGLFSRAVWSFEQQKWQQLIGADASELGAGPGSYDIGRSVWHVNVGFLFSFFLFFFPSSFLLLSDTHPDRKPIC
jgi:high-affinity Fe2+/Pb2+ permease